MNYYIGKITNKLFLRNLDYDAVLFGDIQSRHNAHVHAFKAHKGKQYLGLKWVAHPANQARKRTVINDSAFDDRQKLIRAVRG